jgi:hypothetical protein
MTDEREKSGPGPFISRWSRLKSEARQEQPSAVTLLTYPRSMQARQHRICRHWTSFP